jgi:hypothetical protein
VGQPRLGARRHRARGAVALGAHQRTDLLSADSARCTATGRPSPGAPPSAPAARPAAG